MHSNIKLRVGVELSALVVLTAAFLVLFPQRLIHVDAGLAVFAMVLVGLNWEFTNRVIWVQFPADDIVARRFRQAAGLTMLLTAIVLAVFMLTGLVIANYQDGWHTAWRRIGNWHILPAIAVYLPWALLQQTLFQKYLLGRLLTLLPRTTAVIATGVAYSLVHLPDPLLMAVTAAAGIVWTWLYFRFRCLTPLAVSHACLGAGFYYWIYNQDLLLIWGEFFN